MGGTIEIPVCVFIVGLVFTVSGIAYLVLLLAGID